MRGHIRMRGQSINRRFVKLRDRLGHASTAITLNVCAHLLDAAGEGTR